MSTNYNPKEIEGKWQKIWSDEKAFAATNDYTKPKYYALVEFPYPSGQGLHVGHPRPYTALDIVARKRRMQGYNVLYPMGWDAFGLPTENYAIKNHIHPKIVTRNNVERFKGQLQSLGYSFDWDREINTTDPNYYHWTQWIFLKLFNAGLAYKAEMPVNWCTSCKVGLANEEVVNGVCERCGSPVIRKMKSQWMLKITEYADKLIDGLDTVDYIERVKVSQKNWIGVALSWMNAYINGDPVTERAGYQVETNALWYNCICFALEMEDRFGAKGGAFVEKWSAIRDLVKLNYMPVFWNEAGKCLADYVDNNGQNTDVRPNQLIAIWVINSPVDEMSQASIFKVVSNELETSRGIRTLSPRDPKYKCVYEGSQVDRDLAYHQGSTRPFLLEYYVTAGLRIHGPSFRKKAEWLCEGLYEDLSKHGVGAFSELYDGDPPQEPHGAIASALSTAALLSIDFIAEHYSGEVRI